MNRDIQKQRILDSIKVDPIKNCWLWQKSLDRTGYARIKVNGKRILIHRLSYLLFKGDIPIDDSYHGICVKHTCDVRHCCNPDHLSLGTHADNMKDMVDKSRAARQQNEDAPNAILTNAQVFEIRRKHIPFVYTGSMLAEEYGVSNSAIYAILSGHNWSYLK